MRCHPHVTFNSDLGDRRALAVAGIEFIDKNGEGRRALSKASQAPRCCCNTHAASTPAEVDEKFAQAGLTRQAVMAATLFKNIDVIARIEELIAMAEARRNSALRELDRHRAVLGQATRRAIEQIEQIEDAKQKEKAA